MGRQFSMTKVIIFIISTNSNFITLNFRESCSDVFSYYFIRKYLTRYSCKELWPRRPTFPLFNFPLYLVFMKTELPFCKDAFVTWSLHFYKNVTHEYSHFFVVIFFITKFLSCFISCNKVIILLLLLLLYTLDESGKLIR